MLPVLRVARRRVTLKQEITRVLLAANFKDRETRLPIYDRGGCFEVIAGVGAEVRVAWWDASDWDRRKLLERFAVALEAAGFEVEDRDQALYVAQD